MGLVNRGVSLFSDVTGELPQKKSGIVYVVDICKDVRKFSAHVQEFDLTAGLCILT